MKQQSRMDQDKKPSSSVARAIAVLEAVTQAGSVRFAELQNSLDFPKASLHRALSDLQQEKLIHFDERSQLYSTGFRVLTWASRLWSQSDLRTLSHDQLEWLREQTGETVQLAIHADSHIVCIDSVESHENIRMSLSVGAKAPVYCTAAGKVLLAWLTLDEQRQLLDSLSFAEFTASTMTRPDVLMEELGKVRQQGFAEEQEEHFNGIYAQAVPLLNKTGQCVAAISIAVPTFRMDDSKRQAWMKLLALASSTICERLVPGG